MILNSNLFLAAKDYVKDSERVTVLDLTGSGFRNFQGEANIQNGNMWEYLFIPGQNDGIRIDVYFKEAKQVDLIALLHHTFPAGAEVKVELFGVSANPSFGTPYTLITKVVGEKEPALSSAWGEFSWGALASEEVLQEFPRNMYILCPQTVLCANVKVTVTFTSVYQKKGQWNWFSTNSIDALFDNEKGYKLSRLWISSGFQPTVNVNYGAEVTFIDERSAMKGKSGTKFFETQKVRRRAMNFTFELLPKNEMMPALLGPFHMRVGKSEELIAILEPTKEETFLFSAVYGYVTELDKASYPWWEQMSTTISIEEAL